MKNLFILFLSLISLNISAQPWVSATPFPDPNEYVNCILKYNGELYIGGEFTQVGGLVASKVAKWSGTNWSTLGSGLNYTVNDLIEYNGDIYAATTWGIYKWDGNSWSTELTTGGSFPDNYNSLCLFNGQIAASSTGIVLGSNTSWVNLGSNVVGSPTALCVYNGDLYYGSSCGSSCSLPTGYSTIAKWDGATWIDVAGVTVYEPNIYALTVYNNKLIAGGDFQSMGGFTISHMAAYDGVNWSSVGDWPTINSEVSALSTLNNKLYAGSYVGKWSGSNWQKVLVLNGNQWDGLGDSNTIYSNSGNIESVFDILDYNNELFVAGNLKAGLQNQPYHFIKLDGYSVVGIDELNLASYIEVYPNPTNSTINISLEEATNVKVTIRNSLGQRVMQDAFKNSITVKLDLDIPAGLYFLEIEANGNIITKKLIKQ
tara:strand:+ start:1295 stop:2581 length:1287 start_codon:yes stop_codon:yes gene_type:complete